MTAQYDGNGYYTVYLGNRTLILSEAELLELQDIEFDGSPRQMFEEKLQDIKDEVFDLAGDLDEIAVKIDEKLSTSEINLDNEQTKILEIIGKLQQI